MLGHIFYFIGIFILFSSLSIILKYKKIISIQEWIIKFKSITGKNPNKEDYRSIEERNLYIGFLSLTIFELIWEIFGILTPNWYIFVILILYSTITNLLSRSFKYPIISRILIFKFLLIKLIVFFYLVINHFHFHYDLLEIINRYL